MQLMKACRSDHPDRSDGWALRPNFNAVDHEPNIHGELAQALCTLMDEDGGTFFGRARAPRVAPSAIRVAPVMLEIRSCLRAAGGNYEL